MFGSQTSGGALFGGAAPSGGLFGGATSSGGGLFGGGGAASSGGLFGGAAASSGGLFGAAPASSGAASSGAGLFGAANSGGGLFGGAAASGAPSGGLFGGAASSGGGIFGSAASSGGGLFGGAPASGGGLFGGASSSGGGLFSGASSSGSGFLGAASTGAAFGGFGASTGGTLGAGSSGGVVLGADAQLLCVELAKRMEELYPTLRQASGQPSPAGVGAASALQQSFVAYTYSFCADPQRLQQANSGQFNPQVHVDYAKWVQAMQNNPDPSSCYPEPLVGLPALEARVGMQQKAVEDCTNALEELRSGFGNLKDALQAQSLQKLEECRRRHQMLSHQLLQVVAAVETWAAASGAARRNPDAEAALDARLARLEGTVCPSVGVRACLEELWLVLRGLLQSGPPKGGAARLGNVEAERTLKLTAQQGELLELLQEDIARRIDHLARCT